uniref:AN1-type domain-containing protein n=1 Tax=Graphocephala atropunctata TaxID=36148 RepID=A0A1B6LWC0_9HEMI
MQEESKDEKDVGAASDLTNVEGEGTKCTPGESSKEETKGAVGGREEKDDQGAKKMRKNRCAVCRKKVGLTGFVCRCGGLYCAAHRYAEDHDCTFDYRGQGKEEIRRNNPVVIAEKVQKI